MRAVSISAVSDHPRSRGVYAAAYGDGDGQSGSSPLARGLRRPGRDGSGPVLDHPRSRGVYGNLEEARNALRWIIPARAGFTPSWPATLTPPPDHPRSRGVYIRWAIFSVVPPGSSPLARGLPLCSCHRARRGRIIPARAGFTAEIPEGGARRRDHPRSRGVYVKYCELWPGPHGSSPLARGLPSRASPRRIGRGIIPARAGFTASTGTCGSTSPDHPRSRGVYLPC